MTWRAASLGRAAAIAVLVFLAGCVDFADVLGPHHNRVVAGNPNGLIVEYYGDVDATVPLARQHCLQFEKVPLRISYTSEKATYACVPPGAAPNPPGAIRGELNPKLTLITDLLTAGTDRSWVFIR